MFDIGPDKAKEIIQGFQIPVKPQALTELQQEQAKSDPCPSAFAEVIAKDVALSAGILKAINSPLYGLNRTVTDIKQSVMMLGTNNVNNIAIYIMLKNSSGSDQTSISHERYWDTAMETANMMEIVLSQLKLEASCPKEEAYSYGLFRDCGIPLMAMKYLDYKHTLMLANSSPDTLFTSIEEQHYQTNHAVVGYFLAKSWNLPSSLCQLILRHHDPLFLEDNTVTSSQKDLYLIAKIASNALHQHKYMTDDCEWLLAKESVLGYLGLSEHDYQDIEDDAKEIFNIQFGLDRKTA